MLSGCIKLTLFKKRKNSGVHGGRVKQESLTGGKRHWKDFDPVILYTCPGRDRQRHTANHQRAKHVIWIVCLCSVVHPGSLCAWVCLVECTKEAVCSPLTSVLLFAEALWCIEKLWLGSPLQTNACEIPLLHIILNNSHSPHWTAFIPFKTVEFNFVAAGRLWDKEACWLLFWASAFWTGTNGNTIKYKYKARDDVC